MKQRRILALLLSLVMILSSLSALVGCNHSCHHEWQDATCTAPKTCKLCSETEGEPAAHSWVEATCTKAKHCANCDAVEGAALEHTYEDGKCKSCGAKQDSQQSSCDHTVLHKESVDMGKLGACDWVLEYESCNCGQVKTFLSDDHIGCFISEEIFHTATSI